MPAFFDLLREESEPAVRVVLGHFVFIYVHPYMDGNGRIGHQSQRSATSWKVAVR